MNSLIPQGLSLVWFLLVWFGFMAHKPLWVIHAKSIFIHIKNFISNNSVSISIQFSSIWPIDRTLSGATILGQSGSGSDGNEGVLHIPQSFSITGTSPSDCFVSYQDIHSGGGGFYSSAEHQSVYSTAPANWARLPLNGSRYNKTFYWPFKFFYPYHLEYPVFELQQGKGSNFLSFIHLHS